MRDLLLRWVVLWTKTTRLFSVPVVLMYQRCWYNWSNVVKSLKSYSFIVMTVFEAIFIFVWYLIYMEYGWSKLKSKILSHLFNSNLTLYNSHIKLWIVILNCLKACRIAYVGKYVSPFFNQEAKTKRKKIRNRAAFSGWIIRPHQCQNQIYALESSASHGHFTRLFMILPFYVTAIIEAHVNTF